MAGTASFIAATSAVVGFIQTSASWHTIVSVLGMCLVALALGVWTNRKEIRRLLQSSPKNLGDSGTPPAAPIADPLTEVMQELLEAQGKHAEMLRSKIVSGISVSAPGRQVCTLNFEAVVAPFKQHSTIVARQLVQGLFGQWSGFDASIEDVQEVGLQRPKNLWVTFDVSILEPNPMAFFGPEWRDRLIALRGQTVRVFGKISDMSEMSITLTDCELLSRQ